MKKNSDSKVGSTIDPTMLTFTALSLDSNVTTGGGDRDVYANGTMTAVFYLGWSYYDTSNPSSSPTVDDINAYLKADGNVSWGCWDKTNEDGTPLPDGWSVSTEDNNFPHDIKTIPSSIPSSPKNNKNSLGSNSPSGVVAFYILPKQNDTGAQSIYCYLTSAPTVTSQLSTSSSYARVVINKWSFGPTDFIFNGLDQDDSNWTLSQLNYLQTYVSNTPSYTISSHWKSCKPRASDYTDDNKCVYMPFNAGPIDDLFLVLYDANDDNESSGRCVYLLNGDEDLGKNLTTLNGSDSDYYTCAEEYYFWRDETYRDQRGVTTTLYGTGFTNLKWDNGDLVGPIMAFHYGRQLQALDMGTTTPPPQTHEVKVNQYQDTTDSGDNGGQRKVLLQVIDSFGTEIEFDIRLNNLAAGKPDIKNVSLVD